MTWYLRTRYEDRRRSEIRERHYLDNGEVWFVVTTDGVAERSMACRFDRAKVAAARAAVGAAGLDTLDDIAATGQDLAVMTYEWQLEGSTGRWVDAAYPAEVPDIIDRLEEALQTLEQDAG